MGLLLMLGLLLPLDSEGGGGGGEVRAGGSARRFWNRRRGAIGLDSEGGWILNAFAESSVAEDPVRPLLWPPFVILLTPRIKNQSECSSYILLGVVAVF